MTIREYMNRKKKRVALVASACFGCFVLGVVLSPRLSVLGPILILPALGGVFACLGYAQNIAFRCPTCNGPWAFLVWKTGFLFAIDHRLRYCPYCAADIDAKGGADIKPIESDLLG